MAAAAAAAAAATSICSNVNPSFSPRRLSSAAPAAVVSFNNNGTSQVTAWRSLGLRAENHAAKKIPFAVVFKLGGSSLSSAAKMRGAADLVLSHRHHNPVVAVSAMAKTTENLLIAGEKVGRSGDVSDIPELEYIIDLHFRAVRELDINCSVISQHLKDLKVLLEGIAIMKKLTPSAQEFLVSFGDRMCTTIFAALLNKIGAKARPYDFSSKATNKALIERLHDEWVADPAIPVVTNYLGEAPDGSGSTSTDMTIGKAMGLPEIDLLEYGDGFKSEVDAMPVIYQAISENWSMSADDRTSIHTINYEPGSTSVHLPGVMSENEEADDEKCPMPTPGHQNTIGARVRPYYSADPTNPALFQSLHPHGGMPEIYEVDSENCSRSDDDRTSLHTRRSNHQIPARSKPVPANVQRRELMSENEEADYERSPMPPRGRQSTHTRHSKSSDNRRSNIHQESKKSRVGSGPAPANSPKPQAGRRALPSDVRDYYQDSTSSSSGSSSGGSRMSNRERGSSGRSANSSRPINIGHHINCGSGTQKSRLSKCGHDHSGSTKVRDVGCFTVGDMDVRGGASSRLSFLNGIRL